MTTKMNNNKMTTIGNKLKVALQAAGYDTTAKFVAACAAEAKARRRRQATAKTAKKAAAIVAAKKARDERRAAIISKMVAKAKAGEYVSIPPGLTSIKKALVRALARDKEEMKECMERVGWLVEANALKFSGCFGPEVTFGPKADLKDEADLLKAATYVGGTVYRVGGSVRDELLGIEPNDYDYVIIVPHAAPAARRAFENKYHATMGREYPVARFEFEDGRKVEVSFSAGTIESDLSRRDTTMNAIAKRVIDGVIVDPFNGAADLKAGIVRHVNVASFNPLAAFRAARQVCKMEHKTGRTFAVAQETLKVMHDCKPELSPAHRVRFEWYDVTTIEAQGRFLSILQSAGISLRFEEMQPDRWGNKITPVITVV